MMYARDRRREGFEIDSLKHDLVNYKNLLVEAEDNDNMAQELFFKRKINEIEFKIAQLEATV